ETLLIPINESGAYIKIDAETEQPLDIEAVFQRDFQLEWPAGLGGTYLNWDKTLHAFYFGEEQKKFAAVVGSPTAGEVQQEYATNYSESHENSIDLGVISKGKDTRLIVIAASMNGRAEAESTYKRLLSTLAAIHSGRLWRWMRKAISPARASRWSLSPNISARMARFRTKFHRAPALWIGSKRTHIPTHRRMQRRCTSLR